MTDAIVAMDIDSGKVKWFYQTTPNDNWLGGCGRASGGNPGCPEVQGPDHDFSASPLLATVNGRQLIVVPQKSGIAYALDPDKGTLVWQYRFGQGSGLGGQWGATADGQNVYFGVGDYQTQNPGGMRAVRLATGEEVWSVPGPQPRLCAAIPRCNSSQGGAVTLIPGAVLAGSLDGGLRAYSTEDGKQLWQFDTNREFGSGRCGGRHRRFGQHGDGSLRSRPARLCGRSARRLRQVPHLPRADAQRGTHLAVRGSS
jgi:polyvinyl alcohol dehydrogenase (cytochrome)